MTYTVVWENHAMNEFRRLRVLYRVGAKATAPAVRALADDPRPDAARALELPATTRSWTRRKLARAVPAGRTHRHRACAEGRPQQLNPAPATTGAIP